MTTRATFGLLPLDGFVPSGNDHPACQAAPFYLPLSLLQHKNPDLLWRSGSSLNHILAGHYVRL